LPLASSVSFDELDIAQFDDPDFNATFRASFSTGIASSADVQPYRVGITGASGVAKECF
jgi:hypothetical protein